MSCSLAPDLIIASWYCSNFTEARNSFIVGNVLVILIKTAAKKPHKVYFGFKKVTVIKGESKKGHVIDPPKETVDRFAY